MQINKAELKGEVEISSAKNAVLPVLAAALLTSDDVIINRVPTIADVNILLQIIENLEFKLQRDGDSVIIGGQAAKTKPDPELVKKIRASLLLLGSLLVTRGEIELPLPGGCAIGSRPIDLHLKGFKAMGAKLEFESGYVVVRADKLKGAQIYLDFPSVGATENLILAASLAEGITYIDNAALEPEILDLGRFINNMGGKVRIENNRICIQGVPRLHGTVYTPIPDRIEAGTYMVAAAATAGDVVINNIIPEHLQSTSAKLNESGASVLAINKHQLRVKRLKPINPVYLKTLPYPGFPTDMQPQFMAYLTRAEGSSIITEAVFENRFMHVQELTRMGAKIKTEGRTAIIQGTPRLSAADVRATDLRAGAALLIAGLSTDGTTTIHNSEHIDRGYEKIVDKLNSIGANIQKKLQ